jgi:hypothetical protein
VVFLTKRTLVPCVLALLCLAAYAPLLSIPLIEDDYGNLAQAQVYGPLSGFPALMHDPVFRLRTTSYWAMWLLWQLFHLTAWGYHAASLLLHIANTILLYALLAAWPRTRPAAFWAAGFFAVQEGHQEAVMWFSAINELLMFLFGAAALVCWVGIQEPKDAPTARPPALPGAARIAASAALFGLALLSKESAVVLLPLFLLTRSDRAGSSLPHQVRELLPHLILAALAVGSVAVSRASSFRFSDGSFSLAAPFWITWPRAMARLLWPWGWLAGAVLWRGRNRSLTVAALSRGLIWIGVALLPYSFLTYSTQIPSRQTYLASAGLAILVGMALARLQGRKALAALVIVILAVNLGYLWTRKRRQFLERAAPTEQLIRLARETSGPIWMRCFPRNRYIAETAVLLGAGREPSTLIWDEAEAARRGTAAEFCYRER